MNAHTLFKNYHNLIPEIWKLLNTNCNTIFVWSKNVIEMQHKNVTEHGFVFSRFSLFPTIWLALMLKNLYFKNWSPHDHRYKKYILSEEKQSAKHDEFFYQWRMFLPTILFYRRLLFIDEYSYRHFFTNKNI